MGSSTGASVTVAITGLAAADNPAPGVAVARCLREATRFRGRLLGLSFDHRATGLYADDLFDEVFLVPPPAQGPRAFLDRLLEIHRRTRVDVLLPTLDPEAAIVAASRRTLAAHRIHTLVAPTAAMRRRAKTVVGDLARRFGFEAPRTIVLGSRSAMATALGELSLPFFVKGSFADARLVRTPAEAAAAFDEFAGRWGLPLLAQQRVDGSEVNVAALLDRASRPLAAVAMRKLGVTARGKGWAGVTIRVPDVVARAQGLLRSIGWVGPAELELIRDRVGGAMHVIEVNPRFPAWTYLTAAAGHNLPWLAVMVALGRRVPAHPPAPPGVLFARTVRDHFAPFARVEALRTAQHLAVGGTADGHG